MRRLLAVAALLGLAAAAWPASAAVTVKTGRILGPTPEHANGFEAIGVTLYDGNVPYTEDGITVQYVGDTSPIDDDLIWTDYVSNGARSWYPNGAGDGYTSIKLAGGAAFPAIQFAASTGYGRNGGSILFQALLNGAVVGSGLVAHTDKLSLSPYSLTGDFDEIRLQAYRDGSDFVGVTPGHLADALILDDIGIGARAGGGQAVPEPAAWALMISGFGMLGAAMRRARNGATCDIAKAKA